MKFFKVPRIITWFFPQRVWRLRQKGNRAIYLTFDDGPTEKLSDYILDQLDKFNAKATFFCVGENVEKYNYQFKKIQEKGHAIGNHTNTHKNGWKTDLLPYIKDVKNASRSIRSNLFRPPYGKITQEQSAEVKKLGFKIIMWDVLCYDFDGELDKEKAFTKITNAAKQGSIIVLHDNEKARTNLEYLLPRLLQHFSAKGFTFEPICL